MSYDDDFVFPVYIQKRVLIEIKKLCQASELEILGYLVGKRFKWKDEDYIVIEEQVHKKGAVHSETYTTFMKEDEAGEFDKIFQKIKKKKKDKDLWIVGWWHSHPDFGCFLSSRDVETQESRFPEAYQVALVVDPVRDIFNFFTLDRQSDSGYKAINFALIGSK